MSMTSYLPLAHSQDVKKCDINKKKQNKKTKIIFVIEVDKYSGSVVFNPVYFIDFKWAKKI